MVAPPLEAGAVHLITTDWVLALLVAVTLVGAPDSVFFGVIELQCGRIATGADGVDGGHREV